MLDGRALDSGINVKGDCNLKGARARISTAVNIHAFLLNMAAFASLDIQLNIKIYIARASRDCSSMSTALNIDNGLFLASRFHVLTVGHFLYADESSAFCFLESNILKNFPFALEQRMLLFNNLEFCLALCILDPRLFPKLVILSKIHSEFLTNEGMMQQIFSNLGQYLIVRRSALPPVPEYRIQTLFYVCTDKMFVPEIPIQKEFISFTNLQELWKTIGDFEFGQHQKLANQLPDDNEPFLTDPYEHIHWWFRSGVGVLAGTSHNRVLVAKSLPQFLSDCFFWGSLSYKSISLESPPLDFLQDYWLFPKGRSNSNLIDDRPCSACNVSAQEYRFWCKTCRDIQFCVDCFTGPAIEPHPCKGGKEEFWRVDILWQCYCCSKIFAGFERHCFCKESSCKDRVWCENCALREAHSHRFIDSECARIECSNCFRWLDNQDVWYECQDCPRELKSEEEMSYAMHRICSDCKADWKSQQLSHDLNHIFLESNPSQNIVFCERCHIRHSGPKELCWECQWLDNDEYQFDSSNSSLDQEDELLVEDISSFDDVASYHTSEDSDFQM